MEPAHDRVFFFVQLLQRLKLKKAFYHRFFKRLTTAVAFFSDAVKMQSAFISGERWKFGVTLVCNKKSTDIVQMSSACVGGRVVCIFTSSL